MTSSRKSSTPFRFILAGCVLFFALSSSVFAANPAAPSSNGGERTFSPVKVKLEVPIPFVDLSAPVRNGEHITVPFLAEYLSGVYQFLISIVGVVAGIFILVGGFQYLTAGGNPSRTGNAKKRIINALIGLVLALSSYVILFALNPDLLKFEDLNLLTIETIQFDQGVEDETYDEPEGSNKASSDTTFVSLKPGKFRTHYMKVAESMVTKLEAASLSLFTRTKQLDGGPYRLRGGGFRETGKRGDTRGSQVGKWVNSSACTDGDRSTQCNVCNPFGSLQNYKDGKNPSPLLCPHTSGYAHDSFCEKSIYREKSTGKYYLTDEKLMYVPCQLIFEKVMQEAGFCRLKHESWHYEFPKFSKHSCLDSGTYGKYGKSGKSLSQFSVDYSSCNGLYQYKKGREGTCIPDVEFIERCGSSAAKPQSKNCLAYKKSWRRGATKLPYPPGTPK